MHVEFHTRGHEVDYWVFEPSFNSFRLPYHHKPIAPLFGPTRLTGPNRVWDALIPLYHFIKIIYQKHMEALHFSWHKSPFKYAEEFLKG